MSKVEDKIEKLVTEPIEKLGYKVYDIIYGKEGKDNYLKIFIDNDAGISLDDCEKVNNEITDMLDEANYINEPYFLEVSSPGVERTIRKDKHLEENIGNEICVKTFTAINEKKEKEIIGILKSFDNKNILVQKENEEVTLERKNIALIKKVYKWN